MFNRSITFTVLNRYRAINTLRNVVIASYVFTLCSSNVLAKEVNTLSQTLLIDNDIPEEDGADAFLDDANNDDVDVDVDVDSVKVENINSENNLATVDDSLAIPSKPTNAYDESQISLDDSKASVMTTTTLSFVPIQVHLNAISPTTLKTFVEVIDLVRRKYVTPVSDEELFSDAMSGMLTKLDNHAEFLDAEAYDNLKAFTEGDVGDVGLEAHYIPAQAHWVVTKVMTNTPAQTAGIQVGDYLHQINDLKLTEGKTDNDVAQLLIGIAGTQVDVTISKAGRRKQVLTLQRNYKHEQELAVSIINGIAIVKLPIFQENSRIKMLTALAQTNEPIYGIILDIRNNPGGVLNAAADVVGLFVDKSPIVQIKNRQGNKRILYSTEPALLKDLPLTILQNRYSASAAEVLASSLKYLNRAQIIGETSYGKGSVQSVIPIDDEQAVKLTVAHYLTMNNKPIEDVGVIAEQNLSGDETSWQQQALTFALKTKLPKGVNFVLKNNTAQDKLQ